MYSPFRQFTLSNIGRAEMWQSELHVEASATCVLFFGGEYACEPGGEPGGEWKALLWLYPRVETPGYDVRLILTIPR